MAVKHKTVVNPESPEAEALVRNVTANGVPPESTPIYTGKRNTLVKLNCIDGTTDNRPGREINIKAFRIPPFPNDFIYRFFRSGKAQRSYENALKLIELGFKTPYPIGYGECRQGVRLKGNHGLWVRLTRSYYLCEQLPLKNMHYWEWREDIDSFLPAFAAEIARLHKARVWFKDFSPGNILVDRTEGGEYEFYYVDLNRMEFNVRDEKKLMQMFKSITWCDEWVEKLARPYAAAAGKDVTQTVRKAIEAATRFREKRNFKDSIKHLLGKGKKNEEGKNKGK